MSQPQYHPAQFDEPKLLGECRVSRTRRSGPGGQHRNKVESAVVIEHVPSGVTAEANERRSQHENRSEAIFRLRVNLAIAVRTEEVSESTRELWRSRIRGDKIVINPAHRDFPFLLAMALNTIEACDFDPKAAGRELGVTTSQLVKFLKLEQRGLEWVNRQREQRSLGKLK